ncbi:MAG: BTB/POZ domain-containing protein [Terriglobus roseus]|nr:BTB/POZ domain-containing protein [Terriglobus roseus]
MHRSLLTASSENFAAALTGRFFEASKNTLSLPDTDATIFSHYTDWLYSGVLLSEIPAKTASDYNTLFSIYFFADAYRIPQLKRALMTRIIRVSDTERTIPAERAIFAAFDGLPDSDPLLAWIVDEYVAQWQPRNGAIVEGGCARAGEVSVEFLIRLVERMAEVTWTKTRLEWRVGKDPCDYHAHATEESREGCAAPSAKTSAPPRPQVKVSEPVKVEKPVETQAHEVELVRRGSWWQSMRRRSRRKS